MNPDIQESTTVSTAAEMHQPAFAVGEIVEIDDELGGTYIIRAIDCGFAWLFSNVEGFETVELSELKRPDPSHQTLG